ncbi:MAG: M23 family metallopeptidase [Alistipes sp.]|nr:M23 family metallopeptidase [Alistipes sp.]
MKKTKKRLLTLVLFIVMLVTIFLYSFSYMDAKKFQKEETYISEDLSDLNWEYPFSDKEHYNFISAGYKTENRPDHKGLDIISNSPSYPINGAEIKNVSEGTVLVSKGVTYDSAGQPACDNGGAGNYVVVRLNAKYSDMDNFIVVRYLHMSDKPYCSPNAVISKGAFVGLAGSTGDTPEPHLHIDINASGENYTSEENSVNPILFFPNYTFE